MLNPKLIRLIKYVFSSLIVYVVVKAPIMFLLTEFGDVHYIISGLIAGVVPTIANFIPAEFWVWKRQEGDSS